MSDLQPKKDFSCPRCGVGKCQRQTTTFVDVFDGQLLSVPNVSIYICDVCHFAEFDQNEIESLWDEIVNDERFDEVGIGPHRDMSSYSD